MNKKILIIDDEKGIRVTFKDFLIEKGFDVFTVKNYSEGVTAIDETKFDVIFCDIILKNSTGIELLREIKARNLHCPVIMVTGYPNVETASEAVRLGAFDYITKPVTKETLIRAATTALKYKVEFDQKIQYRTNLEAIFRSVQDAIVTVNVNGQIIEVNDAIETICGVIRSSVMRKDLRKFPALCSGDCIRAIEQTIKDKQSNEIFRLDCQHKHKPDQIVHITSTPLLDDQKSYSGAVMVIRDETRVDNLERNLRERQQFHNIIGKSEEIQKIYALIEDLANVPSTVLITGESGTGKELVAEALHYTGERQHNPLVKVNVSALSEELLESELFGHVKGAFTGAIKDKVGRFQRAHKGTIFLDEIGDMSPGIQARLLRVLQEMEFERVGDSVPIKADVRIIAATNQNLIEKVGQGKFRKDLYYRIKVVELHLSPLKDRREDIPLLVEHFIKQFNKKLKKNIKTVTPKVMDIFMEYSWPGNIRELEHTLEYAFILCHNRIIDRNHLSEELIKFKQINLSADKKSGEGEYQVIINALKEARWNKTKAAQLLGINRRTLYRKIEKYGI